MNTSLRILLQFLRRDIKIFTQRLSKLGINFGLLYPLFYAINFGLLVPNVGWGANFPERTTILFIGSFLLFLQIFVSSFTLDFLFDLEGDQFVAYQSTIAHPRLVYLERIIFATLFCSLLSFPYFIVAKLFLGSTFVTSNMQIVKTGIMILISTITVVSIYTWGHVFIKKSTQLSNLWKRLYVPMFNLGGFMIPLNTMQKFSPFLGKLVLINPVLYITEGLRQTIVGGQQFLSFGICVFMQLLFSTFFIVLGMHYFKKRLDHI